MIQLTGAGKRYGPRILFDNIDWLVTPNERAGIVGANGTGKSSLLKVLAGIEGLDSGTMTTQKGVTLGYLPQEGLSLSGRYRLRRVHDGVRAPAGTGAGAGAAGAPHGGARSGRRGVRPGGQPIPPGGGRVPRARRLHHRIAGGHGAERAGLLAARLEAPHGGVFGRLADAHRARQAAARDAQSAAAGRAHQSSGPGGAQLAGRVSRRTIRTRSCWCRTTATFWT